MIPSSSRSRGAPMALLAGLLLCAPFVHAGRPQQPGSDAPVPGAEDAASDGALQVGYLEIVTPDRDATCALLERVHGVTFGEPVPALGNARTAPLAGGGRLGVRAPMRADEEPVVRPYLVADDLEAAVAAAGAAGGEIAMPPTQAGDSRFAIYFHGGIQYGLWNP